MKCVSTVARPCVPANAFRRISTKFPLRERRTVAKAVEGFAPDVWQQVGFAVGTLALTATVFVAVSYLELQKKIAEQTEAGEDVYQLKVDKNSAARGVRNAGPPETLVQRAVTKRGKKKKGGNLATSSAAAPGFRVGSQKDMN